MRLPLLSLAFVASVGCGNDKPPTTQTEYCDTYAQEICAAVAPACLITMSACTAGRLADCSAQAQQNSRRDFIPSNADACLAKIGEVYGKLNRGMVALTAVDITSINAACANVYRGTKALNGLCEVDVDCLDGFICDKGFCGRSKIVAQGQGCANVGEICPPKSYCSGAAPVSLCVSKGRLGVACNDLAPCLENLRCESEACTVQLGVGFACSVDQDCATEFCEPYAKLCADDVRFANKSAACTAMGG
jgi:hypothetical protein